MRYLVIVLALLLPACGDLPTSIELDLYGVGRFCYLVPVEVVRVEIGVGEERLVSIPEIAPIDMEQPFPEDCPYLAGARFESYYWYSSEGKVEVDLQDCNCERLTPSANGWTRVRMFEPMFLELRITGVEPGDDHLVVVGATYDVEETLAPRDGVLGTHDVPVTVR